jgi:thiamine pyrophosphokinase
MANPPLRAWLITPFASDLTFSDPSRFSSSDIVIAIDGGLLCCLRNNITPNLHLGDNDSLPASLRGQLSANYQSMIYPQSKDETDTQLAVEYCITHQVTELIICNDLSGRFDHALGVVQNLLQAHQNGIIASIETGSQNLFILNNETTLSYPIGTLISLFTITEQAVFTSSTGLQYPLDDLVLSQWQARGISNVILAEETTIRLLSGIVLVVVTL